MKRETSGSAIHLSESHQAAALARIAVATTISERTVDVETARMLEKLLSSLLIRAQLVREVGVVAVTADGTGYDFRQRGKEGQTESPPNGSILGLAASAADELCRLIESPSAGDEKFFAEFAKRWAPRSIARCATSPVCAPITRIDDPMNREE